MDRFLKRSEGPHPPKNDDGSSSSPKKSRIELNLDDLLEDPELRSPIITFHPSDQDKLRRHYLQKGPTQPRNHNYPLAKSGKQNRHFNPAWFVLFSSWLEYSVSKDAAFCLPCYLFGQTHFGSDVFGILHFKNWKRPKKFGEHVGNSPLSAHNIVQGKCIDLMNPKQHIESAINKQSDQARSDYRTRLNASVECVRLLLEQGLAFWGHAEIGDSRNPRNFLKVLKMLARNCLDIRAVALENAPQNHQLTAPTIQKDIVSAATMETISMIMSDLGNSLFSILIDEARDISVKEQMAMVIRYVDDSGYVIERFLGIQHVTDTCADTLKNALDNFLCRYGLSISRLQGRGYDGASNMRGEYTGLKTKMLNENPCAFYVHCFGHQLQLALVAVATEHDGVASLFQNILRVLNVFGVSCKRRDMLRAKQAARIAEALVVGEFSSGQGLNQETSLRRVGDTQWGSHYQTLVSLSTMFEAVIDVLEIIGTDSSNSDQRAEAKSLLDFMESFDYHRHYKEKIKIY